MGRNIASRYSHKDDVAISCRTLCQGKRGFSSSSTWPVITNRKIVSRKILHLRARSKYYVIFRTRTRNAAGISQWSSSSVPLYAHHSVYTNPRNAGISRLIVTHWSFYIKRNVRCKSMKSITHKLAVFLYSFLT